MPLKSPPKTKRDELVDIASSLFYEQGFGATGIKQIIDTVGIAKGTFYSHFTSKEEVGIAWLKRRHTIWNTWLDDYLDEGRTAKTKILALFDFLENWMTQCEFRGCAFINTLAEVPDPESPMRVEIAAHKKELHELIQSLAMEHFVGRSSGFAKQKGSAIFLLFEGALVEAQNFRDVWPITASRKEVKTLLSAE
jgi:AcrR family transcriptional regulator